MENKRIVFVTGNKHKLRECQGIVGNLADIESISIDLPELQEEPEKIAFEKCNLAYEKVREKFGNPQDVMVDDVSLGFNALNGLPGPYIKDFLKRLGNDGLVKLLSSYEDKSCFALCTIGYRGKNDEKPTVLVGRTNGTIVPPRGEKNFGWDPIFQPQGYNKTYAELEEEVKNKISHRLNAYMKLKQYLEKRSASGRNKRKRDLEEEENDVVINNEIKDIETVNKKRKLD